MDSRERAREWALLWDDILRHKTQEAEASLVNLLDAHAAERVRKALNQAAQIAHVEWSHQPSGSPANEACVRINDAIRALLKEASK